MEIVDVTDTSVRKQVAVEIEVPAGGDVEMKLGEEDELSEIVPEGKIWTVKVHLNIVESDA